MDDSVFFPFYYDLAKEFEKRTDRKLSKKEIEEIFPKEVKENEWQQEYHLIYNSYVLDQFGI